ncbi:hypothetical protein [Defluviimonas sp. WL0075]|uniref:Uncharacterized protein n=1 Tax=Albidovulum sediminicola TaxID=2984331 RepID=A0ABT2Z141_9RHOB|nr:hypothetical protein [Defluviimonas sp. WL0075]MCV2864839.1 hypothetical protein [Defluviimonas sp. WL0075]
MGVSQNRRISRDWQIGFEIEVVLDDLADLRFSDSEGMDIATASYCKRVADILRRATGHKWTAPRTKPRSNGFYVVPEALLQNSGL